MSSTACCSGAGAVAGNSPHSGLGIAGVAPLSVMFDWLCGYHSTMYSLVLQIREPVAAAGCSRLLSVALDGRFCFCGSEGEEAEEAE